MWKTLGNGAQPHKKDTTISLSVCSACRCISTKWVMMDLSSSNAMGAVAAQPSSATLLGINLCFVSNIHVCAQQSVLLKETAASDMAKFDDSKSRPRPASIACGFGHLNMAHARGRLTYTISKHYNTCVSLPSWSYHGRVSFSSPPSLWLQSSRPSSCLISYTPACAHHATAAPSDGDEHIQGHRSVNPQSWCWHLRCQSQRHLHLLRHSASSDQNLQEEPSASAILLADWMKFLSMRVSCLLLAVLFCLLISLCHFVQLSELRVDLLLVVVQVLRFCAPFRQSGVASFFNFFFTTGSSGCDAVSVLCLLAPPPVLPCGSFLRGSPQAPTPLLVMRHFVIIGSR